MESKDCYESCRTLTELRQRIETLTAERDDARRQLCNYKYREITMECPTAITAPQLIAQNRGWDCFKEAVNGSNNRPG